MAVCSIAAVVVTHNAATTVIGLLDSLTEASRGGRPRTVVIDNGSTDNTRQLLENCGSIEVLEQHNTGYAHGVNRGIATLGGAYNVLILNADVRLMPGALDRLADRLQAADDVGIVVPRVLDATGHVAPSLRRQPTAPRTLFEAVVGGSRAGRFGERFRPHGDGPQDVDWATGAAMLVRAEAWGHLGPLSEAFFLYSEETEYCLRARARGWRVVCEPAAAVMHVGGDMATNDRLWALRAVNRVRLHRCLHGPFRGLAMWLATLAFESRRAIGGQGPSRLAVRCLLRRDLDQAARDLTVELGGDPSPMVI